MGFFEELKATAGQVIKKVGETVGDLKDRGCLEVEIYKVNQQIHQTQEAMKAAHEAMGRRVYELFTTGVIQDSQLVSGCQESETLARRIEELTAQVGQLREEFQKQQETKTSKPQDEDGQGQDPGPCP